MTTVGVLHPGAMGSVLAAVLECSVLWVDAGRSAASRDRATANGFEAVASLRELAERCDVILSVCPPGAAVEVAAEVAAQPFDGIYVDANAIAPATARTIAGRFDRFVDGGIVGPPPTAPGLTRLYLSGPEAGFVAELFVSTPVETRIVDGGAGGASAVKACFAAWTKGSTALLLAIRALAEAEGVSEDLLGEWATSMPDLAARSERSAAGAGPKAWRFEGEMRELAAAFDAQQLPDGFHLAAADTYHRLAELKDSPADLDRVVNLLLVPPRD